MSFRFLSLLSFFFAATGWGQAVLRPGDVFEMRLTGAPAEMAQEVSQQYTVLDDGEVHLPLIGSIRASGATVGQFSRAVERRFVAEKIFTKPTVIISLPAQSRTVTVGGGVRTPGVVVWSPDLTLSTAIARAGGFNDFGKRDGITAVREGRSKVYNLNRYPREAAQNPKLLPGDEITVKE